MTNEENINSIVKEVVIFGNELSVEALKYALSLMAKRKDEEFKKYLQLTKLNCSTSAKTVYAYDMSSAYELEIMAKCCDNIINDFFNKIEQNDAKDRETNTD